MSLYLKYRPHNFENLVGQDYIRQTIQNSIQKDNIAHAYLFCGTRGTGKTSTARIVAKAVNCLERGETGEPCNRCKICIAIDQGSLVDLIEIDAASNRGIDEIRELKENIQFSPSQSKKKIYIIDEVHMLTKEAFNALLKTLEEPPEHAYFILATTEIHKIPETIISRCQRFNFRRINTNDIVGRLKYIAKEENFTYEDTALELIAKQANGGMRDAIGLLEQMSSEGSLEFDFISKNLGLVGEKHVEDFFNTLVKKNTKNALEYINYLVETSYDLGEFNREFLEYLREKMLLGIKEQSSIFELIDIIEIFTQAGQDLKNALIPQLPLEIAVIKICEISTGKIEEKKDKKSFFDTFSFGSESKGNEATTEKDISKKEIPQPSTKENQPETITTTKEEVNIAEINPLQETPEFNLEVVKNNWQKIINHIPTAFVKMSFKASTPLKAENNTLTIAFQTKFHKEKLSDSSNKNEVIIALEKVFQQNIKLDFTDLEVKLEPTIIAKPTQTPEAKKTPTANEIAAEVFTFID